MQYDVIDIAKNPESQIEYDERGNIISVVEYDKTGKIRSMLENGYSYSEFCNKPQNNKIIIKFRDGKKAYEKSVIYKLNDTGIVDSPSYEFREVGYNLKVYANDEMVKWIYILYPSGILRKRGKIFQLRPGGFILAETKWKNGRIRIAKMKKIPITKFEYY